MLTAKEVIENIEKYKYYVGGYYVKDWHVTIWEHDELFYAEFESNSDNDSYWISYDILCEIKEFVEWLKGRDDE